MFELPQEFSDAMKDSMQGERVELPFTAPIVWWLNGKAHYKALGGAAYFGGWASNVDDLEQAASEMGVEIPPDFKQVTLSNNEGKEYEASTSRAIAVAVIAKRQQWVVDDTTGKGRGHTNILAYMAEKKDNKLIPWGPVVISGKGLSGRFITDALAEWDKASRAARHQHANGLPPWFFFVPIGTFGDKPVTRMVGKIQQSPVTPCALYQPQGGINEKVLQNWFVGEEIAGVMVDLKQQASEWLAEWNKAGKAREPAEAGLINMSAPTPVDDVFF